MTPGSSAPRVARASRGAAATGRPNRSTAVPAAVPAARPAGSGAPRDKAARRERVARSTLSVVADNPLTTYYLILGTTLALLAIGLPMVLSSSSVTQIANNKSPYGTFSNQALFAGMGLVVMVAASRLPPAAFRRLAWPALTAAVVLLALVPVIGLGANGNRSWLKVGPVIVQPAEMAKLALAVWLATVLARKRNLLGRTLHALVPAVPGALAVVGLVLVGKDLGTALVLMLLVVGALFVAGVRLRVLLGGMVIAGALVVRVLVFNQAGSNRLTRIQSTLEGCQHAATNAATTCYQSLHSFQALGTGGLTGVGLGASREKWSYLPEAPNDFIFAVIGEELGLLGTLLVITLIGVLSYACLRLVRRHPDPFVQIATGAVACWVIGQAVLNIGVVVGIFPVIGVPLPLVSAGGSALVTTLAAMGLLLAFARTEPGAALALAARPSVARRSLAVVGGVRRSAGRTPAERRRTGRRAGRRAATEPDPSTARQGRPRPVIVTHDRNDS
ncbi:putative lipid II flippase FtsW [Luteimicrobium subarcticum]|uniref:Probable peptidoglycan glycosyltransferase FtsW n=1 Tax=Luteimicrobium subarcticum TaxID=620910 RepID=A0A2M8WTW8_9MICO|nr:putative lipid II flippase FtsW [Luteimicrobium subarcticum]PJI94338.1 cell division-specific peptidoglycan biosynthesis regulator FtsW [Luteimicrobium subarcticum]